MKKRNKEHSNKAHLPSMLESPFNVIVYSFGIVFLTILICSTTNIVSWSNDNKNTEENIKEIEEIVDIQELVPQEEVEVQVNPPAPEVREDPYWDYIKMPLINVDFSSLLSKNSDTVGWIQVSGTNINYPIVQAGDNDYYLSHAYNKSYNSAGWVFMDYRNNKAFSDNNTIIYAHGRLNKTMFGSLANILKSNWYNDINNHTIKLSTPTENSLWQVFSVYHIPTTTDYLQTTFSNPDRYQTFLTMLKDRSYYNFNTQVNSNDKIITLSTCYGQGDTERVVLHAKLIKTSPR